MFRNFGIIALAFITVIAFSDCKKKKKKTVEDNLPYQTVNITIYPNDPLYNAATAGHAGLSQIGGWAYVNGGINGIVVYRRTQSSSSDFVAIERTSTYLPDNSSAAVKVQTDNFTLRDTVSNSKWQITDGAIISGPATQSLKLYSALYDNGSGALYIRN